MNGYLIMIDVRFKNNGLDSIEVQDNGSGISKEDYASIGASTESPRVSELRLMSPSTKALYFEAFEL